jgi:hypothetical protein
MSDQNKTTDPAEHIAESVTIWRNEKGKVQLGTHTGISLLNFRILVHEAEYLLVVGTIQKFKMQFQIRKNRVADTLPLTTEEREVLFSYLKSFVHIREEKSPWTDDIHEEYGGMRIMVRPDAANIRREMIES